MCLPTTWQRTCMWKACSLLQKLHPKTICTCHYGDKGDHCLCWNWWYQWLHLTSSRVRSMLRVLRLFHSLGDSSFPCYPARCKRPEQGALRGGRGLPISELEPHSWRLWWLEQKLCLDTVFKRQANVDRRFPRRYAFGNVLCFTDGLLHFVLFGTYLACMTSFLK